MTKIYSSSPYYDDYDNTKNYHRVLFRPGRAVQARELTQLQTALSDQVKKFGDFVFKDGSIVTGCSAAWGLGFLHVKIKDTDVNGSAVDVSLIKEGSTLTGLTSNVTGYVLQSIDGNENDVENPKVLIFKYTSSNNSVITFANSEQIQVRNPAGSLITTVFTYDSSSTGGASALTIGDGIIYVNGVFANHSKQTVVLDKFSHRPNVKIGVSLVETVITSDDDETLLDPAVGSSNYFASGADRYKVSTVLTTKSLTDEDDENFYLLYEMENGVERRSFEKPQLNTLLDTIAERTFEESGDYTVKPFNVRIREHYNSGSNGGLYSSNAGNISKLIAGIEPGAAYVRGYRIQNLTTENAEIDKGIDVGSEQQQPISFGYGNYILIKEVSGPWDVDNGSAISLRDSFAQSVSNVTYGDSAAPGSEIGTARVKSVVYEEGSIGKANGQYRVYLYDVSLTGNVPFANVKSIYYNDTSTDSFGDVVVSSGNVILQESNFNLGLFPFPQKAIKSLRTTAGAIDNSYTFKKSFNATIAVDGSFSVTSIISNEEFPFSLGALNNTQKKDNIVVVLTSSGQTANLAGNVTFLTNSNVVYGNATTFSTNLKAGDSFIAGGNVYKVANVTSNTVLYVTNSLVSSNVTNGNYSKKFFNGEYLDLTTTGSGNSSRTATLVSDSQITFDIDETLDSTITAKVLVDVQKTNEQEIQKTLRKNRYVKINCSTAGTSGTYNLGFSDVFKISAIYLGTSYSESGTNVTDQFNLDNGQRDTVYTHGSISLKPSSTLSLTSASRLLIKLDYFIHDTSSGVGFLTVDSYPIDDTEVTPDTIKTEQIPVFTSPSTGIKYDLRNCVDIRPRFTDTAVNATSIGSASENPASPSSLSVPSGGLRVPSPNENYLTDLDFYLSRVDRIYVDKSNLFGVVRGIPGLFPNAPDEPAQSMSVALVYIPPYPSLPPQSARNAGRYDYMSSVKMIDNRRYTMKDIGGINQRINVLEYYTSLSFLEKQAKDLVVPSDVTGLDRFKNGFLVDSFTGHNIGNVLDPNYKVSIDPAKGELRPKFDLDNIQLKLNQSSSSNYLISPKDAILTLTSISGTFEANTVVTQGAITASIVHRVDDKIYVENATGSFSESATITSPDGSATVSNVKASASGSLITLPYTHEIYAYNPFATKPRNCAGDLLFVWTGEILLDPPADNWADLINSPDVVVNFDNNLDNWLALDQAWGTQWGAWQTVWTGVPRGTTTVSSGVTATTINPDGSSVQEITQVIRGTVDARQERIGTNLNVVPETVNYDLGNRVVDVSVVPFMRSIRVNFYARRLKPNSRLYAFFDGESVSNYVAPVDGNYGDPLITDSTGSLDGYFLIPNNDQLKFRVGTKEFKLSDDVQNRRDFSSTFAAETFTSQGISQTQEKSILSSRQARVGFERIVDTRTVEEQSTFVRTTERFIGPPPAESGFGGGDGGGGGDPLAQTFIIDRTGYGTFITKIDVYFRTKAEVLPITLRIREVFNGTPSPKILPFGSCTLYPEDINVSEDASKPTVFAFPSPVFLQEGIEYCFDLLPAGNNPYYNIWCSELGENVVGTNRRVSEQPYVGILFSSANNRSWSPFQAEDLKFTMYRAKFETGTNATVVLENRNEDFLTVGSLTGTFNVGDNVSYASGTGIVDNYDTINQQFSLVKNGIGRVKPNVIATGNITSYTGNANIYGTGTLFAAEVFSNAVIYVSNTNTRLGKVKNVISDTQILLYAGAAENVTSGQFLIYDELVNLSNINVTARVETVNSKYVTLFDTNINTISFFPNEISWQYKIRDDSTNAVSSYEDFVLNDNTSLSSMGRINSNSIEDSTYSNTKSLSYKTVFSTTDNHVSPIIDMSGMSAIIVRNNINNDSTGETGNFGNASARYISRQVILDTDQDAEDLKVYVTGYKPPETEIEVYAKLLNANDSTSFNNAEYIKLELVTSAIVVSSSKYESDFKEYEYKIPSTSLTGPAGEVQYVSGGNTFTGYKSFAIKIVLLSSDPAIIPRVKDYRAIALQL